MDSRHAGTTQDRIKSGAHESGCMPRSVESNPSAASHTERSPQPRPAPENAAQKNAAQKNAAQKSHPAPATPQPPEPATSKPMSRDDEAWKPLNRDTLRWGSGLDTTPTSAARSCSSAATVLAAYASQTVPEVKSGPSTEELPQSSVHSCVPASPCTDFHTGVTPFPTASCPDRFESQGIVAKGGMGCIHLAHDNVMLRQVALKFLAPTEDADPSVWQQFVEEAQITGQLDHPNIVPVYDLALGDDHRCFFAMKYVDGQTYTTLMQRYHAAADDSNQLYQLLQVFLKVCDAVAFAHERGVVHCDIKPDNVMVGSHGQVYLMDWGVALLRGNAAGAPSAHRQVQLQAVGRDGQQHIGGTLSYMAPEQAWGRPEEIDARTDVYGLGGLLHFLLTTKPPNYDTTRLDGAGNPRNVERESALPLVPPGLCRITERALSARPHKRHASVSELKAEVESFIAGGGWFATEFFRQGTTILEQGDVGHSAFVITEGECDVFVQYPEGPMFVRTMGVGEVFGEMAVLTGKPRSATVVAKTDVHARVITQASLEQELRRNPLLGSFVRTVVSRFSEHQEAERLSFAPPPSSRSARKLP